MPLFPRIAGPCPYRDTLDAVIVGDWCRMCHRTVVDLTDMGEDEKKRLFSGCADEIPCVRYRLPAAVAAATLAIAASGAAAQPVDHHRHHAARVPKVVPPSLSFPTAGVPALPVQWERHGAPLVEPAVATPAKPDVPGP